MLGGASTEELTRTTRILLKTLKNQTRFRQLYDDNLHNEPDWVIADTFCHPIERTFTIVQLAELLSFHKMEIVSLFNARLKPGVAVPLLDHSTFSDQLFDTLSLSDRQWLKARFYHLDDIEKLHLLEMIF